MAHPVFRDGVPPEKGNARVYLPLRLGNADALRALDDGDVRLVYIDSLRSFFRKDTADTTTPDNGTSTIHDFNAIRWKRLQAGGLNINAAGPISGRDAFDGEEPGFVYFATDEELIYVRLDAGGWSDGTAIRGPAGTNFEPDETGTFSGRSAFDDEDEGFAYLSIDGDGDEITTAVIFVKLSSSSADWSDAIPFQGPEGPQGASAFVYIAYASADDGTGFTLTFNSSLDYIAVRATTEEIETPEASDFAGLWKRYKGEPGEDGADGADGITAGYYAVFESSTTIEEPTNLGGLRFNHATPASATKIALSGYESFGNNDDIMGDIEDLKEGDKLLIRVGNDLQKKITVRLTDAPVLRDEDVAEWYEIDIEHVGGAGDFTADDELVWTPQPIGPEGIIAGGVDSFNGRTGAVSPAASDYDADEIDFDNTASGLTATDVQGAVDEVEDRVDDLEDTAPTANSTNDRFWGWVGDVGVWTQLTIGMIPDALITFAKMASAAVAAVGDVRAAVASKLLTADLIETASAYVALTDAGPVAVDWDTGINFSLTVTASRQIGNPTNGQPGTYRSILVQGNDGTDHTITFGNQFLGDLPTITDCDSTKWYDLTIKCITATHFTVVAHVAAKP